MERERNGAHTVELVSVEMLCTRVALAAALVRTLKLLVEALSAPPALARGARGVARVVAVLGVYVGFIAVASAAPGLVAIRGRGVVDRGGGGIHLLGKRLELAQVRRRPWVHGQDLRCHRGLAAEQQRRDETRCASRGRASVLGRPVSPGRALGSRGRLVLAGVGWGAMSDARRAPSSGYTGL